MFSSHHNTEGRGPRGPTSDPGAVQPPDHRSRAETLTSAISVCHHRADTTVSPEAASQKDLLHVYQAPTPSTQPASPPAPHFWIITIIITKKKNHSPSMLCSGQTCPPKVPHANRPEHQSYTPLISLLSAQAQLQSLGHCRAPHRLGHMLPWMRRRADNFHSRLSPSTAPDIHGERCTQWTRLWLGKGVRDRKSVV